MYNHYKDTEKLEVKIHILAIDVDKTLTRKACWTIKDCQEARPNRKMIDWVNNLYDTGEFKIIIYTARAEKLRPMTVKWLEKHGVKYHEFGPRKMVYDTLVDDRAYRPEEIV